MHTLLNQAIAQAGSVILGKEHPIRLALSCLLARGHLLIEDLPGVGKTTLAHVLATTLGLRFNRIQFTSDLMPADILGVAVYERGSGEFRFHPGPIFAHLVLADEINRATPKTQSALLEAMEERQITIEANSRPLPDPFVVVATQNPVEYEGTYPLPEAQLDRFLFKLQVGYPSAEQEQLVLARHHHGLDPHDLASSGVQAVAGPDDLAAARAQVEQVGVEDNVLAYAVQLVRATRESPSVSLGVSPRGAAALLRASKAWAWLAGSTFVTPDHVKAVAKPTLRHRLILRPELELEGATPDGVLDGVLASVPAPK